jgi:hypothetical protein
MKKAPIPLTQDEVNALAGGGKLASAARRRMAAQKIAKPARAAREEEKAAPPPLNKKEMAAIKAGRLPAAVRKRISVSSPQPAAAMIKTLGPKLAPSEAPRKKK